MKPLLFTLCILFSCAGMAQRTGIDFTVNIPDKNFSENATPGIGLDVQFYERLGKAVLQITPFSIIHLNATKEREEVIGNSYTFIGAGASYLYPVVNNFHAGPSVKLGLSDYEQALETYVGANLVHFQDDAPLKVGLSGNYSLVNSQLLISLNLGFAF